MGGIFVMTGVAAYPDPRLIILFCIGLLFLLIFLVLSVIYCTKYTVRKYFKSVK